MLMSLSAIWVSVAAPLGDGLNDRAVALRDGPRNIGVELGSKGLRLPHVFRGEVAGAVGHGLASGGKRPFYHTEQAQRFG
jgi:hypothetical protein